MNPFKDWLSFLHEIGTITDAESRLMNARAHDFLKKLANTGMEKTYKMPLLLAFYRNGKLFPDAGEDDIYHSFKSFYEYGTNGDDMLRDKSTKSFRTWRKAEYVSLARRNPIRFLLESAKEYFQVKDDTFCMMTDMQEWLDDKDFVRLYLDTITMRTKRFYKERLEKKEQAWYGITDG